MRRLPLVLASASPRRRELLLSIGVRHEVHPVPDAEPAAGSLAPVEHARAASSAKACAAAAALPGRLVMGADTVVAVGDRPEDVLGKPFDADDARRMLRLLAGRVHRVITGVALARALPDGDMDTAVAHAITEVTFGALPDELVERYVGTGEPFDKAGAYAVQGRIAPHLTALGGSWSNVVGLPVELLPSLFADMGEHLADWQDW